MQAQENNYDDSVSMMQAFTDEYGDTILVLRKEFEKMKKELVERDARSTTIEEMERQLRNNFQEMNNRKQELDRQAESIRAGFDDLNRIGIACNRMYSTIQTKDKEMDEEYQALVKWKQDLEAQEEGLRVTKKQLKKLTRKLLVWDQSLKHKAARLRMAATEAEVQPEWTALPLQQLDTIEEAEEPHQSAEMKRLKGFSRFWHALKFAMDQVIEMHKPYTVATAARQEDLSLFNNRDEQNLGTYSRTSKQSPSGISEHLRVRQKVRPSGHTVNNDDSRIYRFYHQIVRAQVPLVLILFWAVTGFTWGYCFALARPYIYGKL